MKLVFQSPFLFELKKEEPPKISEEDPISEEEEKDEMIAEL